MLNFRAGSVEYICMRNKVAFVAVAVLAVVIVAVVLVFKTAMAPTAETQLFKGPTGAPSVKGPSGPPPAY